jgi:hypothetical protein
LLTGIRFFPQQDFPPNQAIATFQDTEAVLDVFHIVGNVVNPATDMPKVFNNQVFHIVGHCGFSVAVDGAFLAGTLAGLPAGFSSIV